MESTNELGFAVHAVTAAPSNLPTPVYGAAAETTLVGTACRPKHAWIQVEGGDVRYRLDGDEVVEPFGVLARDGTVIDWTDPRYNFSSFIDRMRVVAAGGSENVQLNISWRT